jgi:hypothetical protein
MRVHHFHSDLSFQIDVGCLIDRPHSALTEQTVNAKIAMVLPTNPASDMSTPGKKHEE